MQRHSSDRAKTQGATARVIPAVSCELHASYLRPTPAPRWAGSGHGVGHGVVPVIHHSDTTNDCGSVRTVPQSSPVIVISGFTSNCSARRLPARRIAVAHPRISSALNSNRSVTADGEDAE